MSKFYTIRAGHHRSNVWVPKFHFMRNQIMSCDVTFFPDCIYDLGNVNQYDINKLFGVSFGLHHRDSARFGWRWDTKKKMMEILAYVYRDGERIREEDEKIHLGYVHCGISNLYTLDITDDEYIFYINENKVFEIKHPKLKCWGYYLNPYFGGDEKAPHKMVLSKKDL